MSQSDEIWNRHQHHSDKDEQVDVLDKVGKDTKRHSYAEWGDDLLLLAIDKEANSDRSEDHAPDQDCGAARLKHI